ncbi:hypothetical protein [Aeromonas caviae]|uniref:Uncharacterized protein n=1 Tax=Aeromonas caviae TaxID=648 RepID=A0AAJ6CT79_AERCA|nr:hypothetical protein [Aeromonas caviae]WFG00250.1 hypothetical protein P5S46_22405 [Aeromonas caviae]
MINKRAFALLVLSQIVCGSSALANGTEQQNAADKSEPSEQRELTNVPRLPPEINQKMYGEGVGTIEQLNSDEYRDIYERSTETAKTMDSLSAGQYKQRNTSEPFDERPGAPTKELTLAKGLDTNVVFVDAMGEPWAYTKS